MNDFIREIPGHPDYFVSITGVVLSYKWGRPVVKATRVNDDGYLQAKVSGQWTGLHRLMALAFIPNPDGLPEVNHKNGIKADCSVGNLEWVTKRGNLYHAMRTGLHANPEQAVIGTHVETGEKLAFRSIAEAGRAGFTQGNVSKCISGERPSCKGYTWEKA